MPEQATHFMEKPAGASVDIRSRSCFNIPFFIGYEFLKMDLKRFCTNLI